MAAAPALETGGQMPARRNDAAARDDRRAHNRVVLALPAMKSQKRFSFYFVMLSGVSRMRNEVEGPLTVSKPSKKNE
jgi:hypothetical protein